MNSKVYLGIDIGAESGRVMAGQWDGRRLQVGEVHRFHNGGIAFGDSLRWDVLRLWDGVQTGLGLAANRWKGQLASIGIDTWGVDYALVTASGELVGLPFCYRDARTRGLLAETLQRVPRADIFTSTGTQFMEINTLFQWIAHHRAHPDAFAAASSLLLIPDWLNFTLCGERAVEFTNATTTQFFDPVRRDWARGLLERLELPTHPLGPVVEAGTRLGGLRRSVAEWTGAGALAVVAPATHDTGSAVVGVPTSRTGHRDWAYISSGTWSLVGMELDGPLLTPEALAANVTNEGGYAGTWRLLRNVMGLWLVQGCRQSFEAAGNSRDYAELTYLASVSPAWRSLIDPNDTRFLKPVDMVSEIQSACATAGQPIPQSEGELVRCCLDSLALKYAAVLKQLESLTGSRVDTVHIVGGGSRNDLLNQLTANATGRRVVAGPAEATVLGNLAVQLATDGEWGGLHDMRCRLATIEPLREFHPDLSQTDAASVAASRWHRIQGIGASL